MSHTRQLSDQTVVVIGGSSGIGLETARSARDQGADVIITARDPDRLNRVGLELGASIAAFDATDFDRLGRFFAELPGPIDHVLVTGPGPYYAPLQEFDVEAARRDVDAHLLLPLEVARNAQSRARPGGTLLFMGGTGGRRTAPGLSFIGALTAAGPALTRNLALELAPIRVNLIAAGFVDTPLSASLLGGQLDARRDQLRTTLPIRRVVGPADIAALADSPHGQHGCHRSDVRHRRRPAARRGVIPLPARTPGRLRCRRPRGSPSHSEVLNRWVVYPWRRALGETALAPGSRAERAPALRRAACREDRLSVCRRSRSTTLSTVLRLACRAMPASSSSSAATLAFSQTASRSSRTIAILVSTRPADGGPRPGGARAPPPRRSGVGRNDHQPPRGTAPSEAGSRNLGAGLYRQPGTSE